MYLLIGDVQDLCCLSVRAALEAQNFSTLMISNPLVDPSRFAWWLDSGQSGSQLVWDAEPPVLDKHISGVLVRNSVWLNPIGWQQDDLIYMQTEVQAALLAWLWSLACPVVNRYPPAIWYRPQFPLLSWHSLLRHCGLPTMETLVTNVEQEARSFGEHAASEAMSGVIYGPLTSYSRYLIASDMDWNGLVAMQSYAPVNLAYPHGRVQLVCVVGEQVVWEGEPSPEMVQLEPALRRFSRAAGLSFVELAFASTFKGIHVIAVEAHPHFERFGEAARKQIVDGIVHLITAEVASSGESATPTHFGSLL